MNGIHDLGGMHGFGLVEREIDEPTFHADWERTVVALQQATRRLGLFNLDEFRFAIERMDPASYLVASYYEKWLQSIATNLSEKGIVSTEEVSARMALLAQDNTAARNPLAGKGTEPPTTAAVAGRTPIEMVSQADEKLGRTCLEPSATVGARFRVGDLVIAKNVHSAGHTRLPRYVRGKRGAIDRVRGSQTFPDTNALGLGTYPQYVYSVRFAANELWGESAEAEQVLYIDLWDSYLVPA